MSSGAGRSEALVSRWPAIVMFFAHGALFLLRTPMIALLPRLGRQRAACTEASG
jgi:hypothetical protein